MRTFDYIHRNKLALFGTILFHFLLFLILLAGLRTPKTSKVQESRIELQFDNIQEEPITKDELTEVKKAAETDNSNTMADESAPKNVKSGTYNAYNTKASTEQKESFEEKLSNELKALEQEVIREQRDAGYGFTEDQKKALLHPKKPKGKNTQDDDRPESAFKGNTNITYKLNGRFDTHLKVPVYLCQYGGVVVIHISVNRLGKVTSAKLNEAESKTNDICLIKAALESAKKTKFNYNETALKNQNGTITYHLLNNK